MGKKNYWKQKHPIVYVTVKKPKKKRGKAQTTIEVLSDDGKLLKNGRRLGKKRTKAIKKKAKAIGEILDTYYK